MHQDRGPSLLVSALAVVNAASRGEAAVCTQEEQPHAPSLLDLMNKDNFACLHFPLWATRGCCATHNASGSLSSCQRYGVPHTQPSLSLAAGASTPVQEVNGGGSSGQPLPSCSRGSC